MKKVFGFLRENTRYVAVLSLFLIATFYSLVIAEDAEKRQEKSKKIETEQIAGRTQDLDHTVKSKAYREIFSSRAGDVYRVIIRAKASDTAGIDISARAVGGKLLPIGSFDIPKGEAVFREAVFVTDGEYQDIVVGLKERYDADGRKWDDARVFIDRLSVTRLSVDSLSGAERLNPTVFGEHERVIEHLPPHQDAPEDDSFGMSKNRVGQYFRPTDTIFAGLRFRGEAIGSGGAGSYSVELGECADDACSFNNMKMLGGVSFLTKDMERYRVVGSDDIYEVPISAALDPHKLYYIGINGTKAKASKGNHFLLRKFSGENMAMSPFFDVVFLRKSDILSSAMIQDIGNSYRYEYRMKSDESDIADVYTASGRLKFDKSLAGFAMPQDKDTSMTLRVDTIHPIVSMRMSATGIDTKSNQFVMEYSFDEAEWTEIPYIQREDAPQVFDAAIGAAGKSVVYIRARSVRDGSKFKDWGIKDLAISAVLEKE